MAGETRFHKGKGVQSLKGEDMQEILPLLILVVATIGGILYDRWLYKRAVRQGKEYYISPISLRKFKLK